MRLRWPLLDLISLLVFVVIGRHTHDHGTNLRGIVSTLWPFAVGALVGWLLIWRRRQAGVQLRDGVVIATSAVVVGMVLRVVVGQGTAPAFIVVALTFLNLFLVGWRVVALKFRR